MVISIIFFAFLGFGLGLWIRLFGLLALTVLLVAGALALSFPVIESLLSATAFQLAALAGMAVRYGFTRKVARPEPESPAARHSPSPAPRDHDAVVR